MKKDADTRNELVQYVNSEMKDGSNKTTTLEIVDQLTMAV